LYEVTDNQKVDQKAEFELEKGEDAPMSMAVHAEVDSFQPFSKLGVLKQLQSKTIICGVNSTEEKLSKGENENCRAFTVTEDRYVNSNNLQLLRCSSSQYHTSADAQHLDTGQLRGLPSKS
jgi:hypothetical protein